MVVEASKVINLTPHAVTLVNADGSPLMTIAPSGNLARVSARTVVVGTLKIGDVTVPITKTEMDEVTGLPDQQDGVVLIVSLAVAQRVPDRTDVMIPNESIRDSQGCIAGCKSVAYV